MGSLNDFADVERGKQSAFAELRTRSLGRYIRPLQRVGVTADHITLLGLLFLVPYLICFQANPRWAVLCLLISVLIDGLDGVYARVTGTANDGGALTDICADQIGMVLTALLLIHHDLANPVLTAYYALIYVVMISLTVLQNYCGVPVQITLRSKYPLFALTTIWAFTGWNGFFWLLAVFSLTMTFNALQSFFRLKRHFSTTTSP